jgi:folylpolyglutamate synthase/dihydropteroate synthase
LDSVHAIPRIGAIMTSISMDHQSYLGTPLLKITGEKIPCLQHAPFSVVSKQNFDVEEYIEAHLTTTSPNRRKRISTFGKQRYVSVSKRFL